MKIKISLNPDRGVLDKWSEFVSDHPHGNFFQSPSAFLFFRKAKNYKPFVIYSEDNNKINGVLSGIFMRETKPVMSYFSRRCLIIGGPVVEDGNTNIVSELLSKYSTDLSGNSIYTELRNLYNVDCLKPEFIKNGFNYEEHLNYVVPLTSVEENRKKISSSKKRQIKKCAKAGVEIKEPENVAEVRTFYEILSGLYKRKIKKPLPIHELFEEFYNDGSLGKYFLVKYQNKIVGGIICPIFKDTIYEWYICGLDKKYKNIYPSVLATWAPIEYAAKNGLKHFDFLGAGKPGEKYGVREFKSCFGGNLVNYGRFTKVSKPVLYNIGKAGLKLYQLIM